MRVGDDAGAGALDLPVLYRSEHLLVVDKPSGLATTNPAGKPSLMALVANLDPDAPRLHPSSRLDAEVTGIVTIARTRRATKALLDARKRGLYSRLYLALTARAPVPGSGDWRAPIGLDPREPRRRRALPEADPQGQPAHTCYRTVAAHEQVALLALRPQTGRTHQLRVHAAAADLPLLGDPHYGGPSRIVCEDGRVVRLARVMLHCARVEVPDPSGGGMLTFVAPVPEDMGQAYTRLGGDLVEMASER